MGAGEHDVIRSPSVAFDKTRSGDRPPASAAAQGRGGAAGDDDDVGLMIGDDARHHRLDPRNQLRPSEPSIGKSRIVRDIDDLDVRPQTADLRQHGEAAEPRVEHQRAPRTARVFQLPFGPQLHVARAYAKRARWAKRGPCASTMKDMGLGPQSRSFSGPVRVESGRRARPADAVGGTPQAKFPQADPKPDQARPRKWAWIVLDSFVRFEAFQ